MKGKQFICSPCLPHHSHPVPWEPTRKSSYQFPGFRLALGHLALAPQPCGTTSPLLVHSALSIATFWIRLETHPFYLTFPHSDHYTRWPTDIIDCFMDFAVGLVTWLLHWAWPYWGYGHCSIWTCQWYRSKFLGSGVPSIPPFGIIKVILPLLCENDTVH